MLENKNNVLIVLPNIGKYSETFINYHIKNLNANVFLMLGGPNKFLSPDPIPVFSIFYKIYLYVCFKVRKSKINSFDKYLFCIKIKKLNIYGILAEYGSFGLDVLPYAEALRIPLVVYFRGYDAHKNNPIESRIIEYQELFKYAKNFICVSNEIANILVLNGCPNSKIIVQPSGADIRFFDCEPSFDKNMFCMVGRFDINKGHYIAILALKELKDIFPNVVLNIVGDGELLYLYEDLVEFLGLEQHVFFKGVLSQDDIINQLENSCALIHPAYVAPSGESEGAPNVVLEAQAAGIPVIVSDVGGLTEIVKHDETGFVVPSRSISELVNAMEFVLEDRVKARAMGANGKNYMKNNFTREKNLEITERALGIR